MAQAAETHIITLTGIYCTPAYFNPVKLTQDSSDGSYYYSNSNGSTYYNDGNGGSTYTAPSGKK